MHNALYLCMRIYLCIFERDTWHISISIKIALHQTPEIVGDTLCYSGDDSNENKEHPLDASVALVRPPVGIQKKGAPRVMSGVDNKKMWGNGLFCPVAVQSASAGKTPFSI